MSTLELKPPLFWASLGCSFALHLFLYLFLSGFLELFRSSPRYVPIQVRVVGAPAVGAPQPSPAQAAPVEKHAPPQPPPPPQPPQKELTLPKKPHTVQRTVPQPREKPQPRNPRQSLEEIRELLKRYPVQGTGAKGGGAGEGEYELPAGVAGRLYFQEVIAAVQSLWKAPPGEKKNPVEMEILLDGTGKLLEARLVKSSGNPLLDRSAQSAIYRARFPPPPPGWKTPLKLRLILVPPESS